MRVAGQRDHWATRSVNLNQRMVFQVVRSSVLHLPVGIRISLAIGTLIMLQGLFKTHWLQLGKTANLLKRTITASFFWSWNNYISEEGGIFKKLNYLPSCCISLSRNMKCFTLLEKLPILIVRFTNWEIIYVFFHIQWTYLRPLENYTFLRNQQESLAPIFNRSFVNFHGFSIFYISFLSSLDYIASFMLFQPFFSLIYVYDTS